MSNNRGIYAWYFIVETSIIAMYVGQSSNLRDRKKSHLKRLTQNRHHNPYFQNLYNKYGEASLRYKVLENCAEEDLSTREQYWFNQLSKVYKMINRGEFTSSPMKGRTHSDETKRKLSEITRNQKPHRHADESKRKMSEAKKGKSKGPSHSPEVIKNIRQDKEQGVRYKDLAKKYKISERTLFRIVHYKSPYNSKHCSLF